MAIVLSDVGADSIMSTYFGAETPPTGFVLKLFTDAADPSDADVGYTEMSNGSGYTTGGIALNLEGGSAPVATISAVGGIVQAAWPEQTWNFTGTVGEIAQGYWIENNSGTVIVAERFGVADRISPVNGDSIAITPVIKLGNTGDSF